MVTKEQVQRGISRYIDEQILPHMSGAKRFGVALYVSLATERAAEYIDKLCNTPAIQMLGVYADGMVDIDKIKISANDILRADDRIEADIPIIGHMIFHRTDVDKMYNCIIGS